MYCLIENEQKGDSFDSKVAEGPILSFSVTLPLARALLLCLFVV
jgi:hypothetical protein